MSKMTFKQFLTEVDVGDLQLARQHREKEVAQAEEQRAQQQFTKGAQASFPNKGDVIQTSKGNYIFAGSDKQNVYIQQAGGKPQSFPHGAFGFKATGQQSKDGKAIFNITKK